MAGGIYMFQFAPVSDRIAKIRAKRDAFTQGNLITINSERTKIYTDYYKAHPSEHPLLKTLRRTFGMG
jgi:formate C-acetyltransferase